MDDHVSHLRRSWLYVFGGLALVFLCLPSLIVIPMSFSESRMLQFPPEVWSLRWYRNFWSTPQWTDAAIVSLKLSLATMLIATPVGTAAAYGLHVGDLRYRRVIQAAIISPLLIPVILVAIGLFFVYAALGLVNTLTGLILANTILAVPYVLVTVTSGLETFDLNQENVARSLGASRLVAFLTVTLPQIRHSVIAGAFFAFIAAFDEIVIAIFLSGGENSTLTKIMFASLRDEIDPTIAAVSTMLLVLTLGPPLLLHFWLTPRRTKR